MSEEKDDLKSIEVYKFNNTKENWHEFALKFRVVADSRGYYGVIDGTMSPPDEQEAITVTTENKGDVLVGSCINNNLLIISLTHKRNIIFKLDYSLI